MYLIEVLRRFLLNFTVYISLFVIFKILFRYCHVYAAGAEDELAQLPMWKTYRKFVFFARLCISHNAIDRR